MDFGDDPAAQQLARLQRQSNEKDAIISTQRNAAEDLQRRLVEAKRCVDDATAKLQIEADRAAQAEKLLSRKTDEGRAFQVVKYNLETSLAQAQEKIALGERQIKKLTDEVDCAAYRSDDLSRAESMRKTLEQRCKQLEADLHDARRPSSSSGTEASRLSELESRIAALQAENATLRSTTSAASPSRGRRRSSSFGGVMRGDGGKELDTLREEATRLRGDLMRAENALSALQRSSSRELAEAREERTSAVDEANELRRDLVELDVDRLRADAAKLEPLQQQLIVAEERVAALQEVERRTAELTSHLEAAGVRVAELTASREAAKLELERLDTVEAELCAAEARAASSASELTTAMSRIAELDGQLTALRAEVVTLRSERDVSVTERDAAREAERMQLEIAQQAAEDLREERATNLTKLVQWEGQGREWAVKAEELDRLDVAMQTATATIQSLEDDAHSLRRKLAAKDAIAIRLGSELEDARSSLARLEQESAVNGTALATAQTSLRSAELRVRELGAAADDASKRIEALTAERDEMAARPVRTFDDGQVKSIQAQLVLALTELTTTRDQAATLEAINDGLLRDHRQAEAASATLRDEVESLRAERDEAAFAADARADDLGAQLTTARSTIVTLESRIVDLDAELGRLEAARTETDERNESMVIARDMHRETELEAAKRDVIERTAAVDDALETADRVGVELREAQSRIGQLEDALEDAQQAAQDLATTSSDLVTARRELDTANARIVELEQANEEDDERTRVVAGPIEPWTADQQMAAALVTRLRSERDQALDAREFVQAETDALRLEMAASVRAHQEELRSFVVALAVSALDLIHSPETAALRTERDQLQQRILRRTEQIATLQARVAELEQSSHLVEVIQLRATVGRLETNLALAESGAEEEMAAVDELERVAAELVEVQRRLAESEAALVGARGEMETLRSAVDTASERGDALALQLEERERALTESRTACDELSAQLNERAAELAVVRSAADEAQTALDALKQLEADHLATIATLEADCARHLATLDEARSTSADALQAALGRTTAAEVELAAARAHLNASTAAVSAASAEADKLREEAVETHARLSREIGTLRALVAAKDQANAQLQSDLASTREEAELIVNDFNLLSSEFERRQEQDETRDVEAAQTETRLRETTASLDQLRQRAEAAEARLAELAAQPPAVDPEVLERVAELELLLKRKEEDVEETDDKYLEALKDIKRLKSTIDKLKVKIEVLKQRSPTDASPSSQASIAAPPVPSSSAPPRVSATGPTPMRRRMSAAALGVAASPAVSTAPPPMPTSSARKRALPSEFNPSTTTAATPRAIVVESPVAMTPRRIASARRLGLAQADGKAAAPASSSFKPVRAPLSELGAPAAPAVGSAARLKASLADLRRPVSRPSVA